MDNLRQKIRHDFCIKRKQLPLWDQHQAALELTQIVLEQDWFQDHHKIAFYQAARGEIDVNPLLQQALIAGKKCYLPVLHPSDNNQLCFVEYQAGDPLILNRYKILEPVYEAQKAISPENLEVVLVPLVAFDALGNRLGSGAGYYDRTFAFLLSPKRPVKPLLIGVAYVWQELKEITAEKWDVPLNGVVTEKEFKYFFKSNT